MEKANTLKDILKVADKRPLKGDDFNKFFVDTDKARGTQSADKVAVYLKNRRDIPSKVLFTGHRGSGKSTELWRLQQKIKSEYLPISFSIEQHTDPLNMNFIDLVFIIMEQVFAAAQKHDVFLSEDLLTDILGWLETTAELKSFLS